MLILDSQFSGRTCNHATSISSQIILYAHSFNLPILVYNKTIELRNEWIGYDFTWLCLTISRLSHDFRMTFLKDHYYGIQFIHISQRSFLDIWWCQTFLAKTSRISNYWGCSFAISRKNNGPFKLQKTIGIMGKRHDPTTDWGFT